MTWENTAYELQRPGCLCYHNGINRCTPDACPVHGWRPNADKARLDECAKEKAQHEQSTADYIKRATGAALLEKEKAREAVYRKWGATAQMDMAIEEAADRLMFGAELVDAKIQAKITRLEGRVAA